MRFFISLYMLLASTALAVLPRHLDPFLASGSTGALLADPKAQRVHQRGNEVISSLYSYSYGPSQSSWHCSTTLTATATTFSTSIVAPSKCTPINHTSSVSNSTHSTRPTSSKSSTSSASTSPSSTPSPLPKLAGVYICSDVDWSGTCIHHFTPLGTSDAACTQIDGSASSIGPDKGFQCMFYTNSFCRQLASDATDILYMSYPGNANLLITPKGDYNDRFYSYQCIEMD